MAHLPAATYDDPVHGGMRALRIPGAFPVLETERLRLRRHGPGDEAAILAVFSDPEVTRFFGLETFTRPAQAAEVLARWHTRWETRQGVRWAAELKESGEVVGSGGFNAWDARHLFAVLGYELARAQWGRGLATEMVRAMVAFGFGAVGLHRIEAHVVPGNAASERVLEKAGFRREGVMRGRGQWGGAFHDLGLFALVEEEWKRA